MSELIRLGAINKKTNQYTKPSQANKQDEFIYDYTDFTRIISRLRFHKQIDYLNAIKKMGSVRINEEISAPTFIEENFTNPYNMDNAFLYKNKIIEMGN